MYNIPDTRHVIRHLANFRRCRGYRENTRHCITVPLESSGEFIDGQALSPDGVWVRSDGEGRPPVTDGPFAETKDLIAGWMVIDVDSYERAIELAGELSAAPGAGGEPIHEWLEVRPFLTAPPTIPQCHG